MDCYRGRSRADFDTLHHSMNEFRAVDRSDQHTMEIDGARQAATATSSALVMDSIGLTEDPLSPSILLTQFLAEVGSSLNEQGAWSNWWPLPEDVSSPSNTG